MATQRLQELLEKKEAERRRLGYADTLAEILRQASLWPEAEAAVETRAEELRVFLGSDPLLLSGAGSSHYVSMSIVPSLRRAGFEAEAIPSTEILLDPESALPRRPFTLVSFARSGNSPEGVEVCRLAEKLRPGFVRQLAITCNSEGALARFIAGLSRGKILLMPPDSNDRSLVMTSSFTSMVVAGLALGRLASRAGFKGRAAAVSEALEPRLEALSEFARAFVEARPARLFVLAPRPCLGGAFEAQLKVQEMSAGAIMARAEDSLGFRHGFMAAVDSKTAILLYLSGDPHRRRYELDLLVELRAKRLGSPLALVVVGPAGSAHMAPGELLLELGPELGDEEAGLALAMVGQFIGLHAALNLGLSPDNPSPGGVINRVVQGVNIHEWPEA
ncbi:MAG TPA: sugar isomerase [Rectinemataceae bacterium]|nr:sugar isomerase [Rectinemataceae bacterium]